MKPQRLSSANNQRLLIQTPQKSSPKFKNSPGPLYLKHALPRPPSKSPQFVRKSKDHIRYLTPDNHKENQNKLPSLKKSQVSYIAQTIEQSKKTRNFSSPFKQIFRENSRSPEENQGKLLVLNEYNRSKRTEKSPPNLTRVDLRKGCFSKKQIVGMKENTPNELKCVDLGKYSLCANRIECWDEVNNELSTQGSPSAISHTKSRLKALSVGFKLDKTNFERQLERQPKRTISENYHLLQIQEEKLEELPFEQFVQDLDKIANLNSSLYERRFKQIHSFQHH